MVWLWIKLHEIYEIEKDNSLGTKPYNCFNEETYLKAVKGEVSRNEYERRPRSEIDKSPEKVLSCFRNKSVGEVVGKISKVYGARKKKYAFISVAFTI